MKILFSIILSLLISSQLNAEESSFQIIYDNLQSICASHNDFSASSIDFYKESESQDYEKEFYELSRKLHKIEGSIDLLLKERENTETKETTRCIDNILNTWPG